MISSHPMIELRSLHRYFGPTRAVDDVSFAVQRGQVFGYIGPNGAGKTTSMRILATLDLPTAGDATIDGFSVVDDPDRVRHRLGFMPDYLVTYPNVNVHEYLDFFARAYYLRGRRRIEAVRRVMEFTGLDALAEKPTTGLSKGMKQRLALGRAMIHDPAVLVLDEPAAGLDPRARIELRQMIRALAAQGKTILISSHILTELAEICDTVGIIERGRLLAVGSVSEILDDIQDEHPEEGPTSLVEVRLLDDAGPLADWLAEHEPVEQMSREGRLLRFVHAGDASEQAALLRRIIEADFRVIAFGAKQKSLEDVFMKVTEGRVQ